MTVEVFSNVGNIAFEGPKSKNPLAFKYYNKEQLVMGKPMREWLKFSVVWWHTFRAAGADPFGAPTMERPWDTVDNLSLSMEKLLEKCIHRVDAAFEFFTKLGVDYYAFHDRDISPDLETVEKTNELFFKVVDYMYEKQGQTGLKLLWGTSNLFSHPRYANGGATNPDVKVFIHAAAQVKACMEATHKLGGSGFVFWGGREGYFSLLNTDLKLELDHQASFFRMAVDYKQKIGATFRFFIEPKPKEPTKHQYAYDAETVMGFLHNYGLNEHFDLNIEPNHTTLAGHSYEHDVQMAAAFGKLGSIDCNTGDSECGWDTDQFLMDEKKATLVCKTILQIGGFKYGGLNFDCKVRRESTDLEDLFIAHIGSMDVFAKGLLNAEWSLQNGQLDKMKMDRYKSWKDPDGLAIKSGHSSFEQLEKIAMSLPTRIQTSGKQELFEMVFNDELRLSSQQQ